MFNRIKTELSELLFLSKDALHIHIGLGIYVAAMLLLRRGPASVLPWLVVFAFEMANELVDGLHHNGFDFDVSGALRDIGNTMLWPTVVLVVARHLASRAVVRENQLPADSSEASGIRT